MLTVFAIGLVVFLLALFLVVWLVRRSNRMDYNPDNYSSSTGSWLGSSSSSSSSYSSSSSFDFGSSGGSSYGGDSGGFGGGDSGGGGASSDF